MEEGDSSAYLCSNGPPFEFPLPSADEVSWVVLTRNVLHSRHPSFAYGLPPLLPGSQFFCFT